MFTQVERRNMYRFAQKWSCPFDQAAQRIAQGELDGYIKADIGLEALKRESGQCDQLKIHKLGVSYGMAFALVKDSIYKETIDSGIYKLQAEGILSDLEDARCNIHTIVRGGTSMRLCARREF